MKQIIPNSPIATYLLGSIMLLGLLSCKPAGEQTNNEEKNVSTETMAKQQKASPKKEITKARIVFFGNSLTAGYQLEESNSFPSLIQSRIDSLALPYQCVNAGLSGETTAGGVNRLDWVMEQPIDIFVLELGPNDALRGFDLATTKTNLQAIIDKLKDKYPAVKLVLAGMQAPPNMGSEYTHTFKQIYIDLAKENNASIIPFLLEGVAARPELNLADGIHPNTEGQKIVMENVWAVLKDVL